MKGESKQQADPNIHFLPGDVTRPDIWQKALALTQMTYGRVDVVVNNAGENLQSNAKLELCPTLLIQTLGITHDPSV